MEDKTYNGWSNYATWRVNLELLDDEAENIRENGDTFNSINNLADYLKQVVDDYIDFVEDEACANNNNTSQIIIGYAKAFTDDVNYYEIAENIVSDNPEFLKGEK